MPTVKVISLQRSVERRLAFSEINPHLKFEFIDAVDGSALTPETLNDRDLFMPGLQYSRGAFALALSHLDLWNEAIRGGTALTVCEDDAIFRQDFEAQRDSLLGELSEAWDLVYWGWNFDSILSLNVMPGVSPAVLTVNQEELRNSIDTFRAGNALPRLLPLDKCFGTFCYTISAQGARKFKSLCFPLRNYSVYFPGLGGSVANVGLDVAMNKYYPDAASFVCIPPIAVTKNEHEHSTIQVR